MKQEELSFLVDIKKEIEFIFNNKRYTITYGDDDNGKPYIAFGRLYDEAERFTSLSMLLNRAKIENHFFREMLPTITVTN